ncbi:MAG: 16S rRNA (cytidine(1402)-2'-O)-methyltransferase [Firmicutes bacterium]|nr:16S rRNA (cytidine(1402)-2'-O)-methyltransferase [Bacillota bacterium]
MPSSTGTLYLVGTPLGNLEDLSPRAATVLASVDLVAAEDTRRTRRLLTHLGISRPMVSYHQHSREGRQREILERLEDGQNVALVTDAGMPAISDPGWRLVAAAVARGITVVPIPGPTALVLALAASGLPTASFIFDGFLPRGTGPRRRRLLELGASGVTIVLYESPYRIIETLQDIAEVLGDPPVAVGRELTKIHEEFLRGRASEVAAELRSRAERDGRCLGEFTLVIGWGERRRPGRGSEAAGAPGRSRGRR